MDSRFENNTKQPIQTKSSVTGDVEPTQEEVHDALEAQYDEDERVEKINPGFISYLFSCFSTHNRVIDAPWPEAEMPPTPVMKPKS